MKNHNRLFQGHSAARTSAALLCLMLVLSAAFPVFANDMFQVVGENKKRVEGEKNDRVLSIYVKEMNLDAMQGFAREQAWDGPGTRTVVCFFDDRVHTPDVTFTGLDFSEHYKPHWIAAYYHQPNGDELWVPNPASRRDVQYS